MVGHCDLQQGHSSMHCLPLEYRKLPLPLMQLPRDVGLLTVDAWIPENFFKYYILSMSRSRSSKFFKGRGLGIMSIAIYSFYVSGRYYSLVFMWSDIKYLRISQLFERCLLEVRRWARCVCLHVDWRGSSFEFPALFKMLLISDSLSHSAKTTS